MVDLAVVERDVAVGVGAGAVHGPQRAALGAVGDALFASDGERLAIGTQHDRDDGGFAAQPADRVDRQRDPVGGLADRQGVETVGKRWQVDVHAHFWHPSFTIARRGRADDLDEGDHGELFEGHLAVAVALFDGVELGVDRGPQLGAGFGVDLGVQVPHAGDLVDPAAHCRVRLLTVELADAAVTGEQPGEIAAVLVELGDRVARRGGEQIGFQRRQLRPGGVVEIAGRVGERVDMAGTDRAIGERIFERRQLLAHRGPIGGSLGFFARTPATAAQDLGRGGVDTRCGVRRHTSGDGDIDGVDPPAHPCAQLDNVAEFVVVAHGRVELQQRFDGCPNPLLEHTFNRTYVRSDCQHELREFFNSLGAAGRRTGAGDRTRAGEPGEPASAIGRHRSRCRGRTRTGRGARA